MAVLVVCPGAQRAGDGPGPGVGPAAYDTDTLAAGLVHALPAVPIHTDSVE